jgi:hypothetical protein
VLDRVFVGVLVALLGAVGYLALWFGSSLPVLVVGTLLVALVHLLLRVSRLVPNPSVERTSLSPLRGPKAAAHVER